MTRRMCEKLTYKKVAKSLDFVQKFLERHYTRKILEIHFSVERTIEAEKEYIHKTIRDPLQLNDPSSAGQLPGNRLDIDPLQMVAYILRGEDVFSLMELYNTNESTIRQKIQLYYGGLETFRIMFLKQFLFQLLLNRFSLKEINDSFGKNMAKLYGEFFNGNCFEELRQRIENKKIEAFSYDIYIPAPFPPNVHKRSLSEIQKEDLINLLRRYNTVAEICEHLWLYSESNPRSKHGRSKGINQEIFPSLLQKHFGTQDFEHLRDTLKAEYLIDLHREGESKKAIVRLIGKTPYTINNFTKKMFKGYTLKRLRILIDEEEIETYDKFREISFPRKIALSKRELQDKISVLDFRRALLDPKLIYYPASMISNHVRQKFGADWDTLHQILVGNFILSMIKRYHDEEARKKISEKLKIYEHDHQVFNRKIRAIFGVDWRVVLLVLSKEPGISSLPEFLQFKDEVLQRSTQRTLDTFFIVDENFRVVRYFYPTITPHQYFVYFGGSMDLNRQEFL